MTDESDWIDITPTTDYLRSLRNANHRFAIVLGELIDNAFDAHATRVDIETTGRKGARDFGDLVVSDDGRGSDDLSLMLAPGKRKQHPGTKLGRFGIGSKDAAIWLWGTTQICSVHGGMIRTVEADWSAIEASGRWRVPRSIESKAGPADHGTRITFSKIAHEFPRGERFDGLVAELGYLYAPAIKRGLQITIRTKGRPPLVVPRFELPPLEHVVDCDVFVDGKRAHVHVGVVPDGVANPRAGISYTHGFRVIIQANGLGCGGRNYSRISGWVQLADGDWKLTKNKDALADDEDALGDAVYAVIKDLVDRAAKQSITIRSAALAQSLTQMLRGMAGEGDARREPTGDKPGTVAPEGGPKRHRSARKTRDGNSRKTVNVGAMSINFKHCDEPAIGSVDVRGRMIWLAENHSWVAMLRERENLPALLSLAMALLGAAEPDAQTAFRWAKGDGEPTFHNTVGVLLRDQRLKAVP